MKKQKRMKVKRKEAYYAVAHGRKIGIFKTWEECKQQVDKFQDARFKKFITKKEATEFIQKVGIGGNSQILASAPAPIPKQNVNVGIQTTKMVSVSATKGFQEYKNSQGIPIVYTDGACSHNGQRRAKAGIGVFWGENNPDNVSAPIQGDATNNRAEYSAAICAMEKAVDKGYPELVIRTDSNLMIKSITLWLKKWKKNGWKTQTGTAVANRDLLERMHQLMTQIRVKFEKVEGHSGDYGNDRADELAVLGAELYNKG